MSYTPITVTGSFAEADGSPATGRVTARLSGRMLNNGLGIEPEVVTGLLNTEGDLKDQAGGPFTLYATDDPETAPLGVYYLWRIAVDGAPMRTFIAELPSDSANGTVDISELETSGLGSGDNTVDGGNPTGSPQDNTLDGGSP